MERIRNKALTGVNKANWQTKYFFMNVIGGRIHVGISDQEVFERNSTNFRPGAIDALAQLAGQIIKADNVKVDIDLVNELNQDTASTDPAITAQQVTAVFSYLSLVRPRPNPEVLKISCHNVMGVSSTLVGGGLRRGASIDGDCGPPSQPSPTRREGERR